MPEFDLWKVFVSLGVPGLAIGVFYMLFRRFDWKLPEVSRPWAGPLLLVFMLLVGGVVLFALEKFAPSQAAASGDSTAKTSAITYKKEILALRGDFEALEQYPNTATAIEQEAARLGSLMSNLRDDKLDMARRILKYQYGGWAYLIGARVTSSSRHQDQSTKLSIEMLKKAIEEMAIAGQLHAQGTSQEATGVYEWVTSPNSADLNRTKYLLAIAFAVDTANDGEHTIFDVQSQIDSIDSWYLEKYPIDQNEYLKATVSSE